MDLKGKVLVMLNNDPDWDPKLFAGNRRLYYGRWTYKYESAARQGAAGAIIIHTTPSAGYPWQVVQTSWSGEQFELPADGEPRVQLRGWATEDAAPQARRRLGGKDLDEARRAGARAATSSRCRSASPPRSTFTNKIDKCRPPTSLGLLPGSDPKLKDEVVIYTAHHDHLGIGEPDKSGDKIYNGAVDNASGCARGAGDRAAPSPRCRSAPRRSILIAVRGGRGAGPARLAVLATHPPVPAGKIAANINFDGGNIRGRTRDLTYDRPRQVLARRDRARRSPRAQGRKLVGDQFPDRGFFYRSDQFSFAKIGVPALYLDSGHRLHRQAGGLGQGAGRRVRASTATTSRATSSTEAGTSTA